MTSAGSAAHQSEAHLTNLGGRLNWLRAGVLGANDGIVSVAGILAGVAGAVAGSFSMAGGEYVSVNTQRDTEEAALRRERWELEHLPEQGEAEMVGLYRGRGLYIKLSHEVARELTAGDPLNAHARLELGIDPKGLTSPWAAAGSSFIAFAIGSLLPAPDRRDCPSPA
jgi:VIT1/CCC1 family predicted Fe2+/Mn2+ transporter